MLLAEGQDTIFKRIVWPTVAAKLPEFLEEV